MIEQTVLHLAENIKFRSKDVKWLFTSMATNTAATVFIFIHYKPNLCNKKMATLTLGSSSESNPSFQTFHWKIISLQFNATSVLYVPLFLFEEQQGLDKGDPHMTATFKYCIIRLIVSRLHINYTVITKQISQLTLWHLTSGIHRAMLKIPHNGYSLYYAAPI